MYSPFQKFIPKAAAKYHFTRQFKAIEICQEYRKVAPILVSQNVLEHTFPKSYENHVLTIGVYNSMWAQQVTMQKHRILEAINKKFGPDTIKKILVTMNEEKTEAQAAD